METLENRLQKRVYISLYALLFMMTLLGLSVLLEVCTDKCERPNGLRNSARRSSTASASDERDGGLGAERSDLGLWSWTSWCPASSGRQSQPHGPAGGDSRFVGIEWLGQEHDAEDDSGLQRANVGKL